MRTRRTFLAAAIVPAALAFAPVASTAQVDGCTTLDAGADAGSPDDDVLACESSSYLTCDSALDSDAAGKVHDPISVVPLEVGAAPDTSFTAGAGCGEFEVGGLTGTAMNNIYDLNIQGFVAGNVDTVTFELHSIYAAAQRAGGTINVDLRFDIGGKAPNGTVENVASGSGTVTVTPAPIRFAVDPTTSSTGVSESFIMTVTDLYEVFPELSKIGDGASNYLQVNATAHIAQLDYAGPWVWGATEIPAGVTLNKQGDLGVEISATTLAGNS